MQHPLLTAELIESLVRDLVIRHSAEIIFLYGSYARDDANPESDIDFVCIRSDGEPDTDARLWNGFMLDGWIYNRTELETPEKFLHLSEAKLLLDKDNFGRVFLDELSVIADKQIEPLSPAGCHHLEFWCKKMLRRARRGDAEGHFRRVWLQNDLLPLYFQVRALRYQGPKLAMRHLKSIDEESYQTFIAAIEPAASLEAIEAFVERIFGTQDPALKGSHSFTAPPRSQAPQPQMVSQSAAHRHQTPATGLLPPKLSTDSPAGSKS